MVRGTPIRPVVLSTQTTGGAVGPCALAKFSSSRLRAWLRDLVGVDRGADLEGGGSVIELKATFIERRLVNGWRGVTADSEDSLCRLMKDGFINCCYCTAHLPNRLLFGASLLSFTNPSVGHQVYAARFSWLYF